jgi:hypothetical protein
MKNSQQTTVQIVVNSHEEQSTENCTMIVVNSIEKQSTYNFVSCCHCIVVW